MDAQQRRLSGGSCEVNPDLWQDFWNMFPIENIDAFQSANLRLSMDSQIRTDLAQNLLKLLTSQIFQNNAETMLMNWLFSDHGNHIGNRSFYDMIFLSSELFEILKVDMERKFGFSFQQEDFLASVEEN